MKRKLAAILLTSATLLSLRAQPTESTLTITESGESLSANLDGNPFTHITFTPAPAVTIGGQEEWIVTLTDGYTFVLNDFIPPRVLGEPAGETGINLIGLLGTVDDV